MKIGDLIIRRVFHRATAAINQRELLGFGIVISKIMAGTPEHPCVIVFYPKVGKSYSIAESLVEVVSESR